MYQKTADDIVKDYVMGHVKEWVTYYKQDGDTLGDLERYLSHIVTADVVDAVNVPGMLASLNLI